MSFPIKCTFKNKGLIPERLYIKNGDVSPKAIYLVFFSTITNPERRISTRDALSIDAVKHLTFSLENLIFTSFLFYFLSSSRTFDNDSPTSEPENTASSNVLTSLPTSINTEPLVRLKLYLTLPKNIGLVIPGNIVSHF